MDFVANDDDPTNDFRLLQPDAFDDELLRRPTTAAAAAAAADAANATGAEDAGDAGDAADAADAAVALTLPLPTISAPSEGS